MWRRSMLIGVMSDSHDRLEMIDRAIELFQRRGAEAIVHAGDLISPFAAKRLLRWGGPLYIIFGNNDGEHAGLRGVLPQIAEEPLWLSLGGRATLLRHSIDDCRPEEVERADVVITGHTHEVRSERQGNRLLLNPGESCGYLGGRCTVALLDTSSLAVEVLTLDASD
jgi:putative phosphoesterase